MSRLSPWTGHFHPQPSPVSLSIGCRVPKSRLLEGAALGASERQRLLLQVEGWPLAPRREKGWECALGFSWKRGCGREYNGSMLLKFPSLSGIKWLCFSDPQLVVSFSSFMPALAGLQPLTQLPTWPSLMPCVCPGWICSFYGTEETVSGGD